MGRIHIRLLREIEGVELVGCYDPEADVMQRAHKEYGVPIFDSAAALIEAADAVDVVASTTAHFECVQAALQAGKHVFVEKPIAAAVDEAEKMVLAAQKSNLVLQVGHVERFNPAFLAAQKHTLAPLFVETHRLAEFNPRGTDVSVIMDLMIHDLDIVLKLVSSPVRHISASGVGVLSDSPDIANARIEFENGCVANLTASRISLKTMRRTRLFQKDAYITMDFAEKQAQILTLSSELSENEVLPYVELNTGEGTARKYIRFEQPESPEVNAIKMELECFRDSIVTRRPGCC